MPKKRKKALMVTLCGVTIVSYAFFDIKKNNPAEKDLFYFLDREMKQFELYARRSRYRFLLTIPGDEPDCYRTWEALIFNNIVISKSFPTLDRFLKKYNHRLPIVIIKSYSEITRENLQRWAKKYGPMTSFNSPATLALP